MTLEDALQTRILILDGAMGTMLLAHRPTADDYGGARFAGCLESLCQTRPEWVLDVHRAYLDAGADIIETNTFQGASIVLARYGLEARARDLNVAAARLARQAADEYSTPSRPRFVAGAMGPTTRSIALRHDVTFDALRDTYYGQAKALVDGGVDALLFETVVDIENMKAGLAALEQIEDELGVHIPLMISATIERRGALPGGQTVQEFVRSASEGRPLTVGLNCGAGPASIAGDVRTIAETASMAVSCHPNAGLPTEAGEYPETPESFARQMGLLAAQGLVNIVGGCCGTTPPHIRLLTQQVSGDPRRKVERPNVLH